MAQVNIEVDTSKKIFSVTLDGKKVPDVNEAYVMKHGDYFELSVISIDDSSEDLRRVTKLMANENGEVINTITDDKKLDLSRFFK